MSWREVVPREGVQFLCESGAIRAGVLVTASEKVGPSQLAGGWQEAASHHYSRMRRGLHFGVY